MEKCDFALLNVLMTAGTAAIEYATAPNQSEGIKRVGNRIKKNKTIETIVDCAFDKDSDCDCNSPSI